MKYTSLIAAAAVLSASTYALDAKFGLGVEASNFSLEGKREIGTALGNLAADTVYQNVNFLSNSVSASKAILGLKASANMKMSDRFSLEAGIIVNSGKLEAVTKRQAILSNAADIGYLSENITTTIKPTYGFGVKALFGFNDGFKVGPEIRIQRMETTHAGAIGDNAIDSIAGTPAVPASLETANANVTNAIVEDKVATTETSFGVAMSGMLNDKISVNAGYLTVKAKQHVVTLTNNTAAETTAALGQTAVGNTFNLESEKPTLDQYYVGLSMSF
ncbi:hypothetical protein N9C31_03965 [Gammaproteobacteria bacterium]|nr:hypothetical protein [Gammaproteobacteria bacterium]